MPRLKEKVENRLKEVRDYKNMTQEEFAEFLEIDLDTYKKLENGIWRGIDILYYLADKLNLDAGYLLKWQDYTIVYPDKAFFENRYNKKKD